MKTETTSQAFFEDKYRRDADPWKFASSEYEQGRYEAIVRALGGRRYKRCFEPGCSIGVLTSRLAEFCDDVEAIDISPTAVERARERCRNLPQVTVLCEALDRFDFAARGPFDLIVLSEIGYYYTETQLSELGREIVESLEKGGVLLAAHWLGISEDHVLHGSRVHEILRSLAHIRRVHSEQGSDFVLDTWKCA